MAQASLTRYAWLSAAAAVATIGLKTWAYVLTGSVGLLSDALESGVNLASALMAVMMLTIAARPADEDHPHGHDKAEYFSSGVEGAAILIAAIAIAWSAVLRLLDPQPLEQLGLGLGISVLASGINLAVSVVLMRAGRRHESITLQADAQHLMTDVWTSAGVIVAVALVAATGWLLLDPLIALAVAAHILWTGVRLVAGSVSGLMDAALPPAEQQAVQAVLDRYKRERGMDWHALRTRVSGSRRFLSVHVLVPGAWTVQQGHDLLEDLERDLRGQLRRLTVLTHLEPLEDEVSFRDTGLDREEHA